jgi:serine/threonine protein kinase
LQNDPAAAPEDIHTIRETLARGAGPSAIPNPQSAIEATLDSTIMGTPQFMSPEQARGEIETLDARSDVNAPTFPFSPSRPPWYHWIATLTASPTSPCCEASHSKS